MTGSTVEWLGWVPTEIRYNHYSEDKNIQIGHMYIPKLITGKVNKENMELTFKISPGCQGNGGVRDPLGLSPLKCQQVHQL